MPGWLWFISFAIVIGLVLTAYRLLDTLLNPPAARSPVPKWSDASPTSDAGASPFRLCASLLTPPEIHFYQALCVVIGGEHPVLAKVRLGDLLEVPPGTTNDQSRRNRVQSKHLEFVVCDRLHVRPLAAIELDDASHRRADRTQRDELVDGFCRDAGLALVRFPVERSFDHRAIRERLTPILDLSAAASAPTAPPLPSP